MEYFEFFQTNNGNVQFPADSDDNNSSHFVVEDLLNFPNDDGSDLETAFIGDSSAAATPVDTSAAAEPYFQSGPHGDGPFFNELCLPNADLAHDLEWLSTFVDESFASEDFQKLQLIDGVKARINEPSVTRQYQFQPEPVSPGPMFRPEMLVPAKARSKRSRTAPGNWASRLLVVSPSQSEPEVVVDIKSVPAPPVSENSGGGSEGRKCLHCASEKTPQWRTGPLGPKTLCNACGVRYKSGRLVQEYRPASSPTFVLTKHSNSHRKVLELRRQKEMVRSNQQQQFLHHRQNAMFDVSYSDDYLIHQHSGPDYRQLI